MDYMLIPSPTFYVIAFSVTYSPHRPQHVARLKFNYGAHKLRVNTRLAVAETAVLSSNWSVVNRHDCYSERRIFADVWQALPDVVYVKTASTDTPPITYGQWFGSCVSFSCQF